MPALSIGVGGGRLRVVGATEALAREAAERITDRARAEGTCGEWVELAGARAYLKAEPLRGRARLRHALRGAVLRRPLPRLAEYANLEWLRERWFQAPRPLAAGCVTSAGCARWQFLLTREVEDAWTLPELLAEGAENPTDVLDELAGEVARMHALHFVHRDLYPRNLLVLARGATPRRRIVFLDAWRGGERIQLRGPAHDLGCFFLDAPEWLDPPLQLRFFARYVAGRAAQGKPVEEAPLRRAVLAARAAQLARLSREPDRLRGRALPPARCALER